MPGTREDIDMLAGNNSTPSGTEPQCHLNPVRKPHGSGAFQYVDDDTADRARQLYAGNQEYLISDDATAEEVWTARRSARLNGQVFASTIDIVWVTARDDTDGDVDMHFAADDFSEEDEPLDAEDQPLTLNWDDPANLDEEEWESASQLTEDDDSHNGLLGPSQCVLFDKAPVEMTAGRPVFRQVEDYDFAKMERVLRNWLASQRLILYTKIPSARLLNLNLIFAQSFNDWASSVEDRSAEGKIFHVSRSTMSRDRKLEDALAVYTTQEWTDQQINNYLCLKPIHRLQVNSLVLEWLCPEKDVMLMPMFILSPKDPTAMLGQEMCFQCQVQRGMIDRLDDEDEPWPDLPLLVLCMPDRIILTSMQGAMNCEDLDFVAGATKGEQIIQMTFKPGSPGCLQWAADKTVVVNGHLQQNLSKKLEEIFHGAQNGTIPDVLVKKKKLLWKFLI